MIEIKENDIYNLDCLIGLKQISTRSVDLVITDPPYGINFKDEKDGYNRWDEHVVKGYQEIPKSQYEEFSLKWISECKRVLKKSGSMYIVSGFNNLEFILKAIRLNKLHLQNHLIWEFPFGMRAVKKYVTGHYHILFVSKTQNFNFYPFCRYQENEKDFNGRSLHYQDKYSVMKINKEKWTYCKKTPTKLPGELITKLLRYSSEKGDLVLDPFVGSGQVPFISRDMERRYMGFEISKSIYDFAKERLDTGRYLIPI